MTAAARGSQPPASQSSASQPSASHAPASHSPGRLTGEMQLDEAVEAIRRQWSATARVGLILGTGLGHLADFLQADAEIHFERIPHFPRATALSHAGHLVCGRLAGIPVAVLRGRCHLYEGYSPDQLTLPVGVLRRLGCEILIVSNAAGGLNPQYSAGDIMLVTDHINLMWTGPVLPPAAVPRPGRQTEAPVARAPSAPHRHPGPHAHPGQHAYPSPYAHPGLDPDPNGSPESHGESAGLYDDQLQEHVADLARREGFALRRGVYVGVTGPMYETRAEYRFLRRIGGDVVGMSTVPEVLAARRHGLRVLALSTVTNVATPDAPRTVSGEEVVAAARQAEPRVRGLVMQFLAELAGSSQVLSPPPVRQA